MCQWYIELTRGKLEIIVFYGHILGLFGVVRTETAASNMGLTANACGYKPSDNGNVMGKCVFFNTALSTTSWSMRNWGGESISPSIATASGAPASCGTPKASGSPRPTCGWELKGREEIL